MVVLGGLDQLEEHILGFCRVERWKSKVERKTFEPSGRLVSGASDVTRRFEVAVCYECKADEVYSTI